MIRVLRTAQQVQPVEDQLGTGAVEHRVDVMRASAAPSVTTCNPR